MPFQQFSYHPASVQLLSLGLQLAFLPQRSLFPHNPGLISPSLRCLGSVFLVVSPLQASFWIAIYATLEGLGTVLLPSRFCLDSLDDIVVWNALSICRICLPAVAKGSVSEH